MRKIIIILLIINTFGFSNVEDEVIDATKRVSFKLLGKIAVDGGLKVRLKNLEVARNTLSKLKASYIQVLNKYIQNKYIVTGASSQIFKYNNYISKIKSLEEKVNKIILSKAKDTKLTKHFFNSFGVVGGILAGVNVGYSRHQFMKERSQLQDDFPNLGFEQGTWDLFKKEPADFLIDTTVNTLLVLIETATFGLTAVNYAGGSIYDEYMPLGTSSDQIDARQKWLSNMLLEFKSDPIYKEIWFKEPSNHNLNVAIYGFLRIIKDLNSQVAIEYGLLDYNQLDWLKYYSMTTPNANGSHVVYNSFLAKEDKSKKNTISELSFVSENSLNNYYSIKQSNLGIYLTGFNEYDDNRVDKCVKTGDFYKALAFNIQDKIKSDYLHIDEFLEYTNKYPNENISIAKAIYFLDKYTYAYFESKGIVSEKRYKLHHLDPLGNKKLLVKRKILYKNWNLNLTVEEKRQFLQVQGTSMGKTSQDFENLNQCLTGYKAIDFLHNYAKAINYDVEITKKGN